jgi:hypothetical protein
VVEQLPNKHKALSSKPLSTTTTKKKCFSPGLMAHAYNPSTQEAKAGEGNSNQCFTVRPCFREGREGRKVGRKRGGREH